MSGKLDDDIIKQGEKLIFNPYNNLNIYTPSQILPFSNLYTGGVSSSANLVDGDGVGNFTLVKTTDGPIKTSSFIKTPV